MVDESELAPHRRYRGKVTLVPKVPVRSVADFALWYTPGIAAPCRAIAADPEAAWELTGRSNTIAIISDGTRVLGLGDIGPLAALPVMEGKALLFKLLGGVDAFPLVLDARDPDRFCDVVAALEPSFGGINLEDIAQPKCFGILETLRARLSIPVWHDDQQGTATVALAAVLNALTLVGKALKAVRITLIGAGAANMAVYRLLKVAGVDPGAIVVCDERGILHPGREDWAALAEVAPQWAVCLESNAEGRRGGILEACQGADVLIAFSRPGPGTLRAKHIAAMAPGGIVIAGANPVPEIWPEEARAAGARIVGTGRSDFPNQVNNALAFPGIFRGVLEVRARTISDTMAVAAAQALAACAHRRGLWEDHILPTLDEVETAAEVAVATGLAAIAEGLARVTLSEAELRAQVQAALSAGRSGGPCL